jgi:hypothetical protein
MTHERLKMADDLTVALIACELLEMQALGPIEGRQREVLAEMTTAAQGARDIVRRIDSGFTN